MYNLNCRIEAITLTNNELSGFLEQLRAKNEELEVKCFELETRLMREDDANKQSKKTQTKVKTKQKDVQTDEFKPEIRTDND